MATPTLIRPINPDSLPLRVFSLKEDRAYFGTRRYLPRGAGTVRSHIVVFQKQQDARALQRLFMRHRSNLDDWHEIMNDSWQMHVRECHRPYDKQLTVQEEQLRDLIQLGVCNIVINVVYDMRLYGGVVQFNTRTVEPRFEMSTIRQHYDDLWEI